jgi:glycyl-tRNA synthetase beta chain
VLRILLEQRRDLDVGALVDAAVALQPVKTATTAAEVREFILERLRAHALEAGHPAEAFDAALASGSTRPLDLMARLEALAAFRRLPEAEVLAAANKRIANILRKSDIGSVPPVVDPQLLRETAERGLHAALDALAPSVTSALQAARYNDALTQLAGLRPAVDAFFTEVMVNDPDPALRANRLALVSQVRELFSGVADLSRLPG